MAKASFGMLMETFTRANGKMTKPMAMVCMCMSMARSTRGSGKMTCRMAMVWSPGQMAVNMKVAIKKA